MPLLRNAKKALRASRQRAKHNQAVKSRAKTALDNLKAGHSPSQLATAFSAIDRAVKHHLFHPNKAARLKRQASRLVTK